MTATTTTKGYEIHNLGTCKPYAYTMSNGASTMMVPSALVWRQVDGVMTTDKRGATTPKAARAQALQLSRRCSYVVVELSMRPMTAVK